MSKQLRPLPKSASMKHLFSDLKKPSCKLPRVKRRNKSLLFLLGCRINSQRSSQITQGARSLFPQKEMFVENNRPVHEECTIFSIRPMRTALDTSGKKRPSFLKKVLERRDKSVNNKQKDIPAAPIGLAKVLFKRKVSTAAEQFSAKELFKTKPLVPLLRNSQTPGLEKSAFEPVCRNYINGLNFILGPMNGLATMPSSKQEPRDNTEYPKGFSVRVKHKPSTKYVTKRPAIKIQDNKEEFTSSRTVDAFYKKFAMHEKDRTYSKQPQRVLNKEQTTQYKLKAKTPLLEKPVIKLQPKGTKIDQAVNTMANNSLESSIGICGWDIDDLEFLQ